MKNFKKFVALGLAAVMTLSMAACAGKNDKKEDNTKLTAGDSDIKECTLTFSWWGNEDRKAATEEAVAKFMEKYPKIKVECTSGEFDTMEQKAKTEFPAGTQADVCQVNWNWLETLDTANGDLYYDLNNASEVIDLTQYTKESLDVCTDKNGKLEAMPLSVTGRIFFWNETTFAKAGIKSPTSYAELLAAGKTFETKLGKDFYPLAVGEYDRMILMVYYLETKYDKQWVVDNKINFTQEEVADGLAMIQEMEDNHVIPTMDKLNGDGADKLQENPNWIDGHYAGIWEWDSSASKYKKNLDKANIDGFKVGSYFADWGNGGGYSKISLAMAICNKCKNKKEAALLVNYLLNDPEGAAIMGTERGIPISTAAMKVCQEAGTADQLVVDANTAVLETVKYNLDTYFELGLLKDKPDGKYIKAFYDLSKTAGADKDNIAKDLISGINTVMEEEAAYNK